MVMGQVDVKTSGQVATRAAVGGGVAAILAQVAGGLAKWGLAGSTMPPELVGDISTGTVVLVTTVLIGLGVWAREKSIPILSLIGLVGLVFLAAPAAAEEPPAFGCGGGGCSIYFVDVSWPPAVGVNAAEFVKFRVGAGLTQGFESAQVAYLGGLCLIPGIRDIPLCPQPKEDPAAVPASE